MELRDILTGYGFDDRVKIKPIGSGHINKTYLVESGKGLKNILQEINTKVFTDPEAVMHNLKIVCNHLGSSDYPFGNIEIIPTKSGHDFLSEGSGYWRMLSFLDGREAIVTHYDTEQSEIIGKGYGTFLKYLHDLDAEQVMETIPNFHNPESRFQQLMAAVASSDKERMANAQSMTDHALALSGITMEYANTANNLPLRVTHGDAKDTNILLDDSGVNIMGVIDLDTVMPGYLMNDFGDMVRSMCNTGNEDEQQVENVNLDLQNFEGISRGFLSCLIDIISQEELESLLVGIKGILYEQFIRFLSDYLNNDIYYGAKYPEHNLDRARVHLKLLMDYQTKEEQLISIINKCLQNL
jgi:Ser/Thr protein kinase RdoA (MazF antagonist)